MSVRGRFVLHGGGMVVLSQVLVDCSFVTLTLAYFNLFNVS